MRGTMNRHVQALYLSAGFGDFGDGHDAFACVGGRVCCVVERVLGYRL